MRLLNRILDLFKKDKTSNLTKHYQDQPKTTINESGNFLNNEIGPANNVSASTFSVIVAGVSFYQEVLNEICGGRSEEGVDALAQAKIIPDDNNPYDAYAVKIEIEGKTVAHLSRQNACKWRSKMISEGISGAVTCPAKIVWDRNVERAGSYGVWLDIDLILSDSEPERNSTKTELVPVNQSDQIEFLVNKLNRFELSNCKVGDVVNLWVADEAKEIFIYREGSDFGEGKIGICPDAFFKVISAAPGCDARIVSIYEGGCKIACRLISKAEMAERVKQIKAAEKVRVQAIRDKLREELEKKYSPKTSIKAIFDIDRNHKLTKEDKLYLDIKDKKYYLRNPRHLRMDLLNHKKEKIGETRTADIVIRIVKAHYNGYELDLNVVSFDGHAYYPHAEIEIMPKKKRDEGRKDTL